MAKGKAIEDGKSLLKYPQAVNYPLAAPYPQPYPVYPPNALVGITNDPALPGPYPPPNSYRRGLVGITSNQGLSYYPSIPIPEVPALPGYLSNTLVQQSYQDVGFGDVGSSFLGLIYSASFLNAGFIGLGALWLASYLGHGGWAGRRGNYPGYAEDSHGEYGDYDEYGYDQGDYRRSDTKKKEKKSGQKSSWFRKKRSLGRTKWANREEAMIGELAEFDFNHCAERLVCDLAAVKHRKLYPEEAQIVNLCWEGDAAFERQFPGEGVRAGSPALAIFRRAAKRGRRGQECARFYSKCSLDHPYLLSMIRSISDTG